MKRSLRRALIIIGWSLSFATIALKNAYDSIILEVHGRSPPEMSVFPSILDVVLFAFVGVMAGALLSEPEWILIGYFGSLVFGSVIMFICITLPATLGFLGTAALATLRASQLQIIALQMIFQTMFFGPMIINFISSLAGGFLGEWLGLR